MKRQNSSLGLSLRSLLALSPLVRPLALGLSLAGAAGCGQMDAPAGGEAGGGAKTGQAVPVDQQIARLTEAMKALPGEPAITRSSGVSVSAETAGILRTADKIIHVYSDGQVVGFVSFKQAAPEDVGAGAGDRRVFREFSGDVVIAESARLPDYIAEREVKKTGVASIQAVGLSIGHGGLFNESTVPYEVDGSFAGGELTVLRQAVAAWNNAVGPSGEVLRVRFVPRYPNDGRPYVRFVRARNSGACGSSQVGRHDHFFSNWWSHNIDIECVDQGTIQHEMGHTVGLFHEQQRCDRDQYMSVAGWGINCDRYCGGGVSDHGPFNYLSIMTYPYNRADACSISQIAPVGTNYRGSPWQAGQRAGLDTYDVSAINQMYLGRTSLPGLRRGIYYQISPQHATSKVVAIPASSLTNGVGTVLYDNLWTVRDQHWEIIPDGGGFFEIRNRNSNKCLEISGWTTADGAALGQWDCFGGDHQKWIIAPTAGTSGNFDLINKFSLKSADVAGAATYNGARVQQWGHNSANNQRFVLRQVY